MWRWKNDYYKCGTTMHQNITWSMKEISLQARVTLNFQGRYYLTFSVYVPKFKFVLSWWQSLWGDEKSIFGAVIYLGWIDIVSNYNSCRTSFKEASENRDVNRHCFPNKKEDKFSVRVFCCKSHVCHSLMLVPRINHYKTFKHYRLLNRTW